MGEFGIGQPVRRFEDKRLLSGNGRFQSDNNLLGQLYAYVRSPRHQGPMSTDAWIEEHWIGEAVLPRPRRAPKLPALQVPHAPTCSRGNAALAAHAQSRDSARHPGDGLSARQDGRNVVDQLARKLTQPGITAVLHSWGSTMTFHPHLHCVVTGGGLSPDGTRWITCRPRFFLPVRVLSRLFRRLFLEYLERAFQTGKLAFFSSLQVLHKRAAFLRYLAPLRRAKWVVYSKRPFAGPQQVLDYLGRYTHRIAISNNRLLAVDDGRVRFRWKDYRNGGRSRTMTLTADEFIRRFLLHVLPDGFQRIRYYGFLCNRD